jgi:hypothetical protein
VPFNTLARWGGAPNICTSTVGTWRGLTST